VRFIEANKAKPFFLYLPHYAVHTPLGGKLDVIAKYQAKAGKLPDLKQKNATYAALVESVDDSLGTIRAALKRLKLEENTIIVFTSDNGGLLPVTDNSPFRVGKGSAYEGGVRVPLIIHAPGATQGRPASTTLRR
jgi:arylsulfatase A-like enzyme